MKKEQIDRINELYHKSQAEGLTEAERREQARLRREYIEAFRMSLQGQLDRIDMVEEDGSVVNLGEKYGKRSRH